MMATAVWEYPTTIAAILVAIGVIGKSAHWIYKWAGRVDDSLTYVADEMKFNGGSTMRDAVKRIEVRLETIETNQSDVAAELQEFRYAIKPSPPALAPTATVTTSTSETTTVTQESPAP